MWRLLIGKKNTLSLSLSKGKAGVKIVNWENEYARKLPSKELSH